MYSHRQTDARKGYLAIWILVATLVMGACNDSPPDTPRTQVPMVLVGRWENGASESSSFLSFTADGYFEFGSLLETAWITSNCKKTFFTYKSGTMTVQGNTVTLYAHVSTFESKNSCDPASDYEKPGSFETETFQVQIGTDAFGNFMVRTWPDGQVTQYRKS